MPPIPDVAVGTIAAATIAALVSLLGLIVSKEQKTSEFRQAWIDALRSEIASLVAHANAIHGVAMAGYGSAKDAWEAASDNYVAINQAAAHVRLRLNPTERESQAVLQSIERLEEHLGPGRLNPAEINTIEKQLVSDAQALLKKEWKRVRSGEITFRLAKWSSLLWLLSCLAFLGRFIFF